jgi:hypothetical protein
MSMMGYLGCGIEHESSHARIENDENNEWPKNHSSLEKI